MSSLWWRFFKKRTTKTTTATVTSTPSSACASTNNNNTKSNKRSSPVIIKKYAYSPPSRGLPSGETGDGKVFGVELEKSLSYASVAISMVGPDGQAFIYGYVPLLIAKVGMFLKSSGTATEGIFRVSGSTKRINQLQIIFDSEGNRYGRDLDFRSDGYTMHDAASLLRRYLNMMPDPVIPSKLYLDFVAVLQRQLPLSSSISSYRTLIDLLPPTSRYLLLYLLDLLSVFAQSSNLNLMTASNLATVFQPGLVSTRKDGDTEGTLLGFPGFVGGKLPSVVGKVGGGRLEGEVQESATGKEVLEFLIENQKSFVLGLEKPLDSTSPP